MNILVHDLSHYAGDIFAVTTAVAWATAVIFFKKSSLTYSTPALKTFQNLVCVGLLFLSVFIWGEPLRLKLSTTDWTLLAASAILGITLGDTLYVAAIRRVGAGYQAIVDGLYAPLVAGLAFWIFAERLGPQVLLGGLIVIVAIFVAHADGHHRSVPRRHFWLGLAYAILSQLAMAACVVILKPMLHVHSVLVLTAYRFLIGSVALIMIYGVLGRGPELWRAFKPGPGWTSLWAGAILGPYAATLLWFSGFKYTLAGKAAIYNQLSTVLIVIFAGLFLHEPLTKARWLALVIAIGGGIVVLTA